ncbi:MAG: hypothetical protein COW18_11360 [Zetaproteobacteria bacterium CG12_big_fil_rev_8_21_14_0_65_54_13]|nr:MAG: hypothetical protein COX55_04845 [Zetaproteobacteria bacterium CG23_combo_of_CG06-09_8_20_14_all_54_7]PIW45707.1 MAG: hypothetical protein COW18_11360 [Zetaproteobacteria bacterium CG12_big_fil_rev_8_21_14_0_65_54_13]PIX54194.1 MAG: hypothetical protein COZ50_09135 [Zetaproteobacteria bacterium CG_4_10_14_3_um_filter_54_28]PJA29077.1 MAG: hypothetical protein CO188_07545 [Zetaproteobacteria bacterium CG_4_9_14_3_um_filter_54_145]
MGMFDKQKWWALALIGGIVTLWLVRYEPIAVPPNNIMFLDRWSGELVVPGGGEDGSQVTRLKIGG